MADEEKEKEGAEEEGKKGSKLPLIIIAVLVLAGGGGAAYFLLFSKPADSKPVRKGPRIGPLMDMDTLVVNLDEPGGTRYLKVKVQLELTDDMKPELRKLIPRLRDKILLQLSSLTVSDVQRLETKKSIKKKVKETANKVFGDKLVEAVYFKELVMQ